MTFFYSIDDQSFSSSEVRLRSASSPIRSAHDNKNKGGKYFQNRYSKTVSGCAFRWLKEVSYSLMCEPTNNSNCLGLLGN